MSDQSSIEWTEKTWNPLVGCTRVSEGCRHCYAETMAKRLEGMAWADTQNGKDPGRKKHYLNVLDKHGRWNGTVNLVEEALTDPLRWKKPRLIFVNSMSDLFHESVPFEFIDRVFAVMSLRYQHTFQVLTKRPERMAEYLESRTPQKPGHVMPPEWLYWLNDVYDDTARNLTTRYGKRLRGRGRWPLPNVWLGTSVEDQATADERIPHLLRCPAAVRWLSCEPLIGPVVLPEESPECDLCGRHFDLEIVEFDGGGVEYFCGSCRNDDPEAMSTVVWSDLGVDWLVVGGESGSKARPCNVEWIRGIIEQGKAAGVPVFVKQLGARPYAWGGNIGDEVRYGTVGGPSGCDSAIKLKSAKGGDPSEWPQDLRVREYPAQGAVLATQKGKP